MGKAILFLLATILCSCAKDAWHTYDTSNLPIKTNLIRQVIIGQEGLSWIGTFGNGLYQWNNGLWRSISAIGPHEYIFCLKQDTKGGLWVGTARSGAWYFDGKNWTNYSTSQGLRDNNVWDLLVEDDGKIWLGSRYHGMCVICPDTLACLGRAQGLPDNQITAVAKDSTGTVWIGTANSGMCGFRNRQAVDYMNRHTGLSGNYIRAIICDSLPRWVASWDGGLDFFNGKSWERQPVVQPPVVVLAFDPKGRLWAGTWGHGVFIMGKKGWKNIDTLNSGLADNHVIDIRFDEQGKAYMATSRGVAVYDR